MYVWSLRNDELTNNNIIIFIKYKQHNYLFSKYTILKECLPPFSFVLANHEFVFTTSIQMSSTIMSKLGNWIILFQSESIFYSSSNTWAWLKAQLLPRVVLIIDHNICIIGLICLTKYISENFKICIGQRLMWRCPLMQERNKIGSSFKQKDCSFYICEKSLLSP